MSNRINRKTGVLVVGILLATILVLISIQPLVGAPEASSPELAHGHVEEHDEESTHAEQVRAANVEIDIVMNEWGFIVNGQAATIESDGTVKGALPISVKAGDVVQITITNKGEIVHDFNIALGEGEHQHHEGMEHQAESMVLNPGETETITFVAETAGTYTYHCGIPGHTELGMLGAFIVIGEDSEHEAIEHEEEEHHEEEHHEEE